jgi:hypothetical protein
MNSTRSIGGTIPFLWHWYCTYRLFQLQLFWYLFGWALTLFSFSMVTYMWLLVDEFNSQYWWNYPISLLSHWAVITLGSSSSNYFWYLSTRMGPYFCSFQHAQWVVTYIYWMNSTRSIGGTIPTSLTHWSCYCTYRLFQLQLFLVSFNQGWA